MKQAQLHVIDHPLVQHKLTMLRDENTPPKIFRELMHEITLLIMYEATRNLTTVTTSVKTPVATASAKKADHVDVIIVPILRAGLSMVEASLSLLPWAKVGHIGIFRDENTHEPHRYYFKMPTFTSTHPIFICDPMLATGGSLVEAIHYLKNAGAKNITYVGLVAAPEGIHHVLSQHPDVQLFVAAVDEKLNSNAYIVPGLGDAGDRIFGTQ